MCDRKLGITATFPRLQRHRHASYNIRGFDLIKDLSRCPSRQSVPSSSPLFRCPQYGLGEDVYDDDRAAAAKKSAGSEPANGPRVMSGTVQTVVTDRSKM